MKKYSLKINGNEYEVKVENVNEASTEARVVVNGVKYNVEIEGATARQTSKPAAPAATGGAGTKVTCPLPGTVIAINVKEGDTVAAGQTLVVLEAMKMENNIDAERGGVVKSINVQAGATVMEGEVLLVIE